MNFNIFTIRLNGTAVLEKGFTNELVHDCYVLV